MARWVEVKSQVGRQRYDGADALNVAEAQAIGVLVGEVSARGGDTLAGITVTAAEVGGTLMLRVAGTAVKREK
ncbi:MAG: hypothetical protein AAF532_13870 [Planctomycetota bacterium]